MEIVIEQKAITGHLVDALIKDLEEIRNENQDFKSEIFEGIKKIYEEKDYITKNQFRSLEKTYNYFVGRKTNDYED